MMWIFTSGGYLSAVADPTDESMLLVRTRDRRSANMLADSVEMVSGHARPQVAVGAGTDYPYRLTISREDFKEFLTFEVDNYLTYTNFKSEAESLMGKAWSRVLMSVWAITHRFSTSLEAQENSPYYAAMAYGDDGFGFDINPHYDTSIRDEDRR